MPRTERSRPLYAAISAAAILASSCNLDTDAPAPYVAPLTALGACGTTETLLPKLLAFVRRDRFAPLRTVIETRLVPTDANPHPDPSLRSLLGAVVRVISTVGLEKTVSTASTAIASQGLRDLAPLIKTTLRFTAGQVDGQPHYEASDAAALFVRQCSADHLLGAVEALAKLRSPSHQGQLWLAVAGDRLKGLIEDPFLAPFLIGFEGNAQKGRPAIVNLLVQVMTFVGDDHFAFSRVETLLDSAVYPAVNDSLHGKIAELAALLEEATSAQAGILQPLQLAVQCGNAHPMERNALLGFAWDLVTSPAVGLQTVLKSVQGLASGKDAEALLSDLALVVDVLRRDPKTRDPVLALVAMFLSRPDSEQLLPVLTSLIDAGVVSELLDALTTLLGGCGRAA